MNIPSLDQFRLPLIIQGRPEIPDSLITPADYTGAALSQYTDWICMGADAFSGQRPYADTDAMLPGFSVRYEEISLADCLSGIIVPQGKPVRFENMILAFSVVLRHNAVDKELRGYARDRPEYHYKCPPEPPYCSVTPQDLYDQYRDSREAILKTVGGLALVWLIMPHARPARS